MQSFEDGFSFLAAFRRGQKSISVKLPRKVKLTAKDRSNKWRNERRRWRKKYRAYLLSPEWKKRRERRLKRCNGICEYCKSAAAIQVHHLTYKRVFKEWISDLRGICLNCHKALHPGKRFRKFPAKRERNLGTQSIDF